MASRWANPWLLGLLLGIAFLAGCRQLGPVVLGTNRAAYNMAVQRSTNQELLLNLVRLKYREPISFLQITSINSRFGFGIDATAIDNDVGAIDVAGIQYSEVPTLTYTPIEGEEFARRMLLESDMNTFLLLVRGGWSIKRVMRLMVERVGDLYNYPEKETYARFAELVEIWGRLQEREDLAFFYVQGSDREIMDSLDRNDVRIETMLSANEAGYAFEESTDGRLRVKKRTRPFLIMQLVFESQAEADRADKALGLSPTRTILRDGRVIERIRLLDPVEYQGRHVADKEFAPVPIWLRSVGNQLYCASRSVEVPPAHQALVKEYVNLQGQRVESRDFTKDLLDIRFSADEPENAFVRVRYRDLWFFIDDRDWQSKDSFALLLNIFSLQSDQQKEKPVLTIPLF
ncbi:MAG: hypothetical protein R3200_07810 [Xanthomonadales bacterium]|nr:hypothetical protein [Xanthomonadales bacterium]